MHASSNTAAHGEAEWLTGAGLTVRLLERQGVRVLSGLRGKVASLPLAAVP